MTSSPKELDGLIKVEYALDIRTTIPLDTVENDAKKKGLDYSSQYTIISSQALNNVNGNSLGMIRSPSKGLPRDNTVSTIDTSGENIMNMSHNSSF